MADFIWVVFSLPGVDLLAILASDFFPRTFPFWTTFASWFLREFAGADFLPVLAVEFFRIDASGGKYVAQVAGADFLAANEQLLSRGFSSGGFVCMLLGGSHLGREKKRKQGLWDVWVQRRKSEQKQSESEIIGTTGLTDRSDDWLIGRDEEKRGALWADWPAKRLIDQVYQGPFKGLRILPKFSSKFSCQNTQPHLLRFSKVKSLFLNRCLINDTAAENET